MKKKDKRPASYNPHSYTSEHPDATPSGPVRTLKAPKRYEDIDWDSKGKELGKANVVQGPSTYKLAMESVDKDKWITAMNEEYDSLISQKVWTVHDTHEVPSGRKLVGSKWVYIIKMNKDGSIERFKAKLVVKGYSQIPGLDYNKTFAPVTRYDSLRLIIALAAQLSLGISELDIKLALTYGDLDEDIWIKPPPGIGLDDKALHLNQALYGLKQAPKQ